jgi:hypothetical protein
MKQIQVETQTQTQVEYETQKRRIYRQGDVILEQVDIQIHDLELYARLESNKLEIRSENGHSHVMNNIKLYRYYIGQVIVVEEPTPLVHDQHPTLIVVPGVYRIRFVRDWLLRESRPYD